MGNHSTIEYTTGVPGAGKTLMRGPRYLVEEFFRDDPAGTSMYVSNLPLNVDELAAYVAVLYGLDVNQVAERIIIIPEEELKKWRDDAAENRFSDEELERRSHLPEFKHCQNIQQCVYGPWQYFHGADLNNCRIVIDELHHYCGKTSNIHVKKAWQRWLAEARHMGVTIEGMTQDSEKVAEQFSMEAAVRRTITHRGNDLDPAFGIPYGDWYELRAGFWTRKYDAKSVIVERRKTDEQWKAVKWELASIQSKYFPLYNSFSAPQAGGGMAAISQKHEFQKRPRFSRGVAWSKRKSVFHFINSWTFCPAEPGLLRWFVERNFWGLAKRTSKVALIAWFFAGHMVGLGGALGCYQWTSKTIMEVQRELTAKRQAEARARRDAAEAAKPKPAPKPKAAPTVAGRVTPAAVQQLPADTVCLTYIQPDRAAFEKGHVYGIGQRITSGPLAGDTIERIDCLDEFVVMRSGLVLHMGMPTQAAGHGFGTPSVGGPQPSGGAGENPFVAGRLRAAIDDERSRNATLPMVERSSETNGVFNHLRR